MNGMETYHGHVRTPTDAIILFEACRIGLLPRVQRRLSEKERQSIKSGSVFVWDEREAGMRRWTDGKSWSASRVSGSFLTYREMEGKRGGSGFDKTSNRDGMQGNEGDSDGGPDGYRYKPDGLMKQSFSITTNNGQHLHLISYFSRSSATAQNLMQPSNDPQLRHIRPEKGMYPESTVHEQSNIPAVTRGPMQTPGYTHSPNQPYGYGPPSWAPPSPMHTPPPGQYSPYYHNQQGQYPGHSPLQTMHYPPPPPPPPNYSQHHGATNYDRPPPPMSNTGLPPPHSYGGPMAPPPSSYPGGYHSYPNGYSSYQPPPLQAPNYPPPPPHHQPYDSRPPTATAPAAQPSEPNSTTTAEDDRQDSHQSLSSSSDKAIKIEDRPPHSTPSQLPTLPPPPPPPPPSSSSAVAAVTAPPAPASTGQTIPSISAMLNAGDDGGPPVRHSSRSPPGGGPGAPRPLQDIPTHKLGFEANRDVQAVRMLDNYSTLKQ